MTRGNFLTRLVIGALASLGLKFESVCKDRWCESFGMSHPPPCMPCPLTATQILQQIAEEKRRFQTAHHEWYLKDGHKPFFFWRQR